MEQTIGLLGGGQLGQMLCEAANPLGMKVIILDAEGSPAKQINAKNAHINGSFTNKKAIQQLARQSDILTVEIEHVDTFVLEEIAEKGVDVTDKDGKTTLKKVPCSPHWKTLRMIQDKYSQKEHLIGHGVKVAESVAVEASESGLSQVGKSFGYPYMLKARKDAYDGRGNFPVKSESEIPEALEALKGRGLYAEKWACFKMELAVMVVKTTDDASDDISSTIAYPAVETVHEDSICKLVYAPARNVTEAIRTEAQNLARKAVSCLWGKGVFGVELFIMEDNTILLNEIAPRPHNSGHYTIEACPTMSQYKSQLLAITGLMPAFPHNVISMAVPSAIMLNILGGPSPESYKSITRQAIAIPNLSLHLYGKESKPARKIGHITIIADSMSEAEKAISPLVAENDAQRAERKSPTSKPSTQISTPLTTSGQPLVAITMGSDSDLPVLKGGLAILKSLDIPYLVTITSAHRTPDRMTAFAKEAAERGIKVIIAAAGGAAHLPGMIAASTPLPVIGIPVRGSTLDGMDSLLSIVQMPRGVPVATVAINNSVNAALLAARIIGSSDLVVRKKLEKYAAEQQEEVLGKAKKLEEGGWEAY